MGLTQQSLQQKYRIVPGAATVTYKVANTGGGTSIDGARKRPLTFSERMVTPFRENVVDTNWMLPADTLGTIVPKPGDSIIDVDNTTLWIIENVESALMQNDYKCYSVKNR